MAYNEDKYRNDELHPKRVYPKNNGETTTVFGIRLTDDERKTWKEMKLSKTIHKILAGEHESNDSIKISNLNEEKRILMKFFEMVILKVGDAFDQELDDYMMSNEDIFRGK